MKVLTAMRLEEGVKKELKILAVQEDKTIGELVKAMIKNYKEVVNVPANKINA